MCGELAFEAKFKRADELHEKAMDRGRQFFALRRSSPGEIGSHSARPRLGSSYRLKGKPPQAHE